MWQILLGILMLCSTANAALVVNPVTGRLDSTGTTFTNITESGSNVGINTVNPRATLEVNGGLLVDGSIYTDNLSGKTRTYSSIPPPYLTIDYIKSTTVASVSYSAWRALDTTTSLIGSETNNSWLVFNSLQRFHIDLVRKHIVKRIYYENGHSSGGSTTNGVKDFTFWGTNIASSCATTTYATDTGWTQLSTSQSTFDQHTAANTADPKYIDVYNTTSYSCYAFKFSSNWGGATYMNIRRIGLQSDDGGVSFGEANISMAGTLDSTGLYANQVTSNNITTNVIRTGTSSVTPQAVFVGDSLTAGSGGSTTYWARITMPTYNGLAFTKTGIGVAGREVKNMYLYMGENLMGLLSYNSGMNLVVLWAGTNDIAVGTTPEQTFSYLQAFGTRIRMLGAKLIVCSMISRTGYDTEKNTYNTLIRRNWPNFADGFVDLGSNANIGADGASTNLTYFVAGGVHLNDTGYDIVASMVSTEINRIVPQNLRILPTMEINGSTTLDPLKISSSYTTHGDMLTIKNTGYIGVNTTTPRASMEIAGSMTVTSDATFAGSVYFTKNATAIGQAACVTTSGAAGYCTSVVGVGGGCTCTAF